MSPKKLNNENLNYLESTSQQFENNNNLQRESNKIYLESLKNQV